MPTDPYLIDSAVNILYSRIYSDEFLNLEIFADKPEWLHELFDELKKLITYNLTTHNLELGPITQGQVTNSVNALLDEAKRESSLNRNEHLFSNFFTRLTNRFCPRFPIC